VEALIVFMMLKAHYFFMNASHSHANKGRFTWSLLLHLND